MKAVGPHEHKRTMKMIEARKELHRLIDEASAIAPAIIRIKGQSYGEVTDENLNVQKSTALGIGGRDITVRPR